MSNDIGADLTKILNLIESHRQNAYRKINEELVTMYYEIGEYLSKEVSEKEWGSKVIEQIAQEIKDVYPTLKGFSEATEEFCVRNRRRLPTHL